LIASVLDDQVLEFVNRNGSALVLADSEQAFTSDAEYKCTRRAATWLDGRWFSNYNWIDVNSEPYRDLALNRLLAFEARAVTPEYVIENVSPDQFADVLSGITVGWLNLNNALTFQLQIGTGKALVTTYRFSNYGDDPYASHLLNAYIRYASGPKCRPAGQWRSSAIMSQ
jgi:hypothetical protein